MGPYSGEGDGLYFFLGRMFRCSSCLPAGQSRWWDIGAVVNARPTGEMFRLVHKVGVTFKKPDGGEATSYIHDICTMETVERNNYYRVVLFPTGRVTGLPHGVQKEVIEVIRESLQHCRFVVLCGHSMGASWAQMMALECCLQDFPIRDRIYVVGSAPFHWASREERDVLADGFRGQWLFMRNRCDDIVDARGALARPDKGQAVGLPLEDIEADPTPSGVVFHSWSHYRKSITNYMGRWGKNLQDGHDDDSDSDETVPYAPQQ